MFIAEALSKLTHNGDPGKAPTAARIVLRQ